jgi:hypothetical protein
MFTRSFAENPNPDPFELIPDPLEILENELKCLLGAVWLNALELGETIDPGKISIFFIPSVS